MEQLMAEESGQMKDGTFGESNNILWYYYGRVLVCFVKFLTVCLGYPSFWQPIIYLTKTDYGFKPIDQQEENPVMM
jgi:hypothetical protein